MRNAIRAAIVAVLVSAVMAFVAVLVYGAMEIVVAVLRTGVRKVKGRDTRVLTIALLLFPVSVFAQVGYTAGELLRNCEQSERIVAANPNVPSGADVGHAYRCLGFVQGVLEGVQTGEALSGLGGKYTLICKPSGVSNDQLVRVVLRWLRQKPEALHESAGTLVALALMEAFPCRM